MSDGFFEAGEFPFTRALESEYAAVLAELRGLAAADFTPAADSLTTVADGYDERGWLYYDLFGARDFAAHRARCPHTAAVCAAVPGLVNAGFSRFLSGTHLFPHAGELAGVLRCHLALVVPAGDLGLRLCGVTRRWQEGRCLVFDDSLEHDAWNRGDGIRDVLLVTFRPEIRHGRSPA